MSWEAMEVIGIVLAGGSATRIGGGDKGARLVGGRPILDHVAAAMRPQCAHLVVNASGDAARFASLGGIIVADSVPGRPGPLAGVLAGLDWVAGARPDEPFAVTVPTDAPFLPHDLVARLGEAQAGTGAPVACARSGGRCHHVAALWSVSLRHDLRHALTVDGVRQVRRFVERHGAAYADWPVAPYDPFHNVNTPADLEEAERIARLIAELRRREGAAPR